MYKVINCDVIYLEQELNNAEAQGWKLIPTTFKAPYVETHACGKNIYVVAILEKDEIK